ncbi:hypothetical protein Pcinc_001336 [Petrolisthes cinctipes]|uniref:Uncharacterized protein n=1 Tax=Petrolisthes cinctipes TaxID=88211 RepID=A0AAE1L615_PETCI|nr:hypothetical protein Pcinc_001336 [Petrolisthes cinctipes]
MPKMTNSAKKCAKRALLQEEVTAPPPASFTSEPQGEEEPQYVTLQAMEVVNPEDFVPPPPPPPSDTVPEQEADTASSPTRK